jgi:uncharacterized repeat protein (TIGR03806 family)
MIFKKILFLFCPFLLIIFIFSAFTWKKNNNYPEKLSEWNFFKDKLAELNPSNNVHPYELRTPLFSDYAQKARFVRLPSGIKANYNSTEVFDFPVGTVLIKNFYYANDLRKPEKGRRILETRLLIHESDGWESISYIWNDEQTEALLDLAGDSKAVSWVDEKGKKHILDYQIPNKNQCKGCHSFNNKIKPIGPSARQLNGDFQFPSGKENQLAYWKKNNLIENLPENLNEIPKIAIWNDAANYSLDARARAWLDINCAHCHRSEGPASTSGLLLSIYEQNKTALGIFKTPVAAGRGSGGLSFDIEPGKPEKSILVHRMESLDPGVMMPEIARKLVHKEALQLIKDWIKTMEKN